MLKGLAAFVMKNRSNAVALIILFTVLGIAVFPIFMIVSGAILSLRTLHYGWLEGLTVLVISALILLLASLLIQGAASMATAMTVALWLPIWFASVVLRGTIRLDRAIQMMVMISVVAVLMVFATVEDVVALWKEALQPVLEQLMQAGMEVAADQQEQIVTVVAQMFTGVLATTFMVLWATALFLGRYWQGVLYNPGGFGKEFRLLRHGKTLAMVALVIYALAVYSEQIWMANLIGAIAVGFLFQGLAVLHGLVALKGLGLAWVAGAYILMVFLPQFMVPGLTLTGLLDNWFGFRDRINSDRT